MDIYIRAAGFTHMNVREMRKFRALHFVKTTKFAAGLYIRGLIWIRGFIRGFNREFICRQINPRFGTCPKSDKIRVF